MTIFNNKYYRLLFLLAITSLLFACNSSNNLEKRELYKIVDSLDLISYQKIKKIDTLDAFHHIPIWNYHLERGEYNILIPRVISYAQKCKDAKYEYGEICAYICLSEIFLFLGDKSLLDHYLDKLSLLNISDRALENTLNNIYAIDAFKNKLDYSRSLEYLLRCYDYYENTNSYEGMLTSLYNITNIFYLRQDSSGIEYAQRAVSLSNQFSASQSTKARIYIALARMRILEKKFQKAAESLLIAERLGDSEGQIMIRIEILYTKAEIFYKLGNEDTALELFREADELISSRRNVDFSDYYLHYGNFLYETEQLDSALIKYNCGLNIARSHKNLQHTSNLIKAIVNTYRDLNMLDSVENFELYYSKFRDSIKILQREREFSDFRLSYQKTSYEREIHSQEIQILEAKRRMLIIVSALVIIIVIFIFSWISARSKSKARKLMVEQHQKYLFRKKLNRDSEKETDLNLELDSEEKLFREIDAMMIKEKLYLDCNLGIDAIAERLSTNRSYISKAINKYSGTNFSSYLNQFRIEEATDILSSKEIPLKQVSIEVGFSNTTTFYRAFTKEVGCPPSEYKKNIEKIKNSKA